MLHSPKPNKFSPTFCCGICWCFSPLLEKNCKAIFLNSLSRQFFVARQKRGRKRGLDEAKIVSRYFFLDIGLAIDQIPTMETIGVFLCELIRLVVLVVIRVYSSFFQFSVTDKFLAFTFYWHLNVSPGWTLRLNKQTFGSRTSHPKQPWYSSTSSQNKW